MIAGPDILPDLSDRIDGLAMRLGRSRQEIIREALEDGHSLEWQEEWSRRIAAGIEAADRGDFASDEDMAELFAKYR